MAWSATRLALPPAAAIVGLGDGEDSVEVGLGLGDDDDEYSVGVGVELSEVVVIFASAPTSGFPINGTQFSTNTSEIIS